MKIFKILSLCCVSLTILFFTLPTQAEYDDTIRTMDSFQIAQRVFSRSAAAAGEIKIEAWGQISNELLPCWQLEEKYAVVARGLNLAGLKPAVQVGENGFAGVSGLAAAENETCQLSLQAVPAREKQGTGETYLALLYTGSDPLRASRVYSETNQLLKKVGFGKPLGVTFTGKLPRAVTQDERQALAQFLASGVSARFVEGVLQEDLTSLSYYTRQGAEYLEAGGRRINLNIAVRTDGKNDAACLYVGSPLIYQDY
ncbi:MAG: YwmB family TATA-box binding protein [Peptococcaceae bacterium]|jgi:hypothetical protein|nr:YwmB family TATA-box binding protein [Peptococcaceae bacterium]MDH7523712.1 YwmB family TATA-box binding protein [Peptococcaceae bacterium]